MGRLSSPDYERIDKNVLHVEAHREQNGLPAVYDTRYSQATFAQRIALGGRSWLPHTRCIGLD